jgi:hypothetical protein
MPCKEEKYRPKITVRSNPIRLFLYPPPKSEWWAHVIETPEDNKMIVFIRGMFRGLNSLIPKGGQIAPSSGLGEILLWKKAQKNEKKNNTSEVMKKIIPNFIPSITLLGWAPSKVDSRKTSRHHW